ncbi:MAG: anti-sigma factor [Verrucomicrobia bacterium]|nr:anti-sigma factor [Verrucomicrobiota bacterium]
MDEAKEELAVKYVLGELAWLKEQRFRAALTQDRELREFTCEIEEAFALFALAAPPAAPPSDLPARIVRENPKIEGKNFIRGTLVPWALAACLALMCAVLAGSRIRTERKLTRLRDKEVRLEEALADLRRQDLLSQLKITTLQAQIDAYARARAVVIWDEAKNAGLIEMHDLPAPPPGKNYQLWVIDPKSPQPISAGLVPYPASGLGRVNFTPAKAVGTAGAFAVSVEKAGGSQTPQGQIVLLGK